MKPESQLEMYSKILDYQDLQPEKREVTIKHLKIEIEYLKHQLIAKKAYIKEFVKEYYKSKKGKC